MIYLLLPAYNEAKGLAAMLEVLLEEQRRLGTLTIIVVDDGSLDDTQAVLNQFAKSHPSLAIQALKHSKNQGLGSAFRTGFSYLCPRLKSDDIVFTMDADNTHPIECMYSMIQEIASGADLVTPSRFVAGSQMVGVSPFRRFLGYTASWYYRLIFGRSEPREYTCAYRAYRGAILQKAWQKYGENFVQEKGFTATVEILLKLLAFKPNLKEVVLLLRYDKKVSASRMRILKTILAHFCLSFRIRFSK